MSNSLDLAEFHTFLEQVIEDTSDKSGFSTDRIIHAVTSKYPQQLAKIQEHVIALGLRTLIRNNCRAKRSSSSNGPDMFGHYHVGKRVSVPYKDAKDRLRFKKIRRDHMSFEDLDEVISRLQSRPAKPSRELQDLLEIANLTSQFRGQATNVAEGLELAARS